MKRRNFLRKSTGLATAMAIAPFLTRATSTLKIPNNMTQNDQQGTYTHYVLFWLKAGLSEKEINDFTGFFEELRKVPTIKSFHYGRAAHTTPRDVVDNSFTYNLLVYFDSLNDQEIYGTHPIHLKAIEKYSKYWEEVVVHDSVLK